MQSFHAERELRSSGMNELCTLCALCALCATQSFHGERELYSSDHIDEVSSATVLSKVVVHTLEEYSVRSDERRAAWVGRFGQLLGYTPSGSLLSPYCPRGWLPGWAGLSSCWGAPQLGHCCPLFCPGCTSGRLQSALCPGYSLGRWRAGRCRC